MKEKKLQDQITSYQRMMDEVIDLYRLCDMFRSYTLWCIGIVVGCFSLLVLLGWIAPDAIFMVPILALGVFGAGGLGIGFAFRWYDTVSKRRVYTGERDIESYDDMCDKINAQIDDPLNHVQSYHARKMRYETFGY